MTPGNTAAVISAKAMKERGHKSDKQNDGILAYEGPLDFHLVLTSIFKSIQTVDFALQILQGDSAMLCMYETVSICVLPHLKKIQGGRRLYWYGNMFQCFTAINRQEVDLNRAIFQSVANYLPVCGGKLTVYLKSKFCVCSHQAFQ